jgi:cytochrome c biogenesis protein CcmG/thiol:disulfide interchange protein DsbE
VKSILAGLAVAAALCACSSTGGAAASVAHAGQPAPPWTEPLVPHGTLSLASLHGKAVYLNFFASWCPPCNEEAPAIEALQKRYASRGLRVIGIDVLENARKAESFRSEHRLSYPIVVDDGALRNQYNVNGLPVHVFIDRRGTVRRILVGELSAAQMQAQVRKLLR